MDDRPKGLPSVGKRTEIPGIANYQGQSTGVGWPLPYNLV